MPGILLLLHDPTTAEHFRGVIGATAGLEVLGTVGTLAQARKWLAQRTPDLLLTDLQLDDGPVAGLLSELRRQGQDTRPEVLVAALSIDEPELMEALRHGADGYFVHGRPVDAMVVAIHLALAGESPMAPAIARQIKSHFEAGACDATEFLAETGGAPSLPALADHERTLLGLVASGFVPTEIARAMQINVHGVGVALRSMYRKLQFDVRAQALTPSF